MKVYWADCGPGVGAGRLGEAGTARAVGRDRADSLDMEGAEDTVGTVLGEEDNAAAPGKLLGKADKVHEASALAEHHMEVGMELGTQAVGAGRFEVERKRCRS